MEIGVFGASDIVKAELEDGVGNPITSTVQGPARGIDVNIVGGSVNSATGAIGAPVPADADFIGFRNPGGNLEPGLLNAANALLVDNSANEQPVNLNQISGVAPSAANPLPSQLSDGAAFYDARQIRNLIPATDEVKARLEDGAGTALTSQANGGQRALDVGIDVAGVQVDPRAIRNLVPATDEVKARLEDGAGVAITSQVNGAQQALDVGIDVGGVQIDPRQIRALVNTDIVKSQLQDDAGNGLTSQANGGQRALDVGIDVAGVQIDPRAIRALTGADVVTVQLDDGAGNPITSQASGGQRALDVGIDVAGVQIDPRQIRALTNADVVKAQLQDNAGAAIVLGQQLMAASVPVVLASDQTPISVSATQGLSQKQFVRNDYSITSVTTGAYVQLIAALGFNIKEIEIFDSSGQTLKLALGAAGVEVDQVLVTPGGNGKIPFTAAAGQRLSIEAVSATASVGELDINLYG